MDRVAAIPNSKIRKRISELEQLVIDCLEPELNVVGVAGAAKPLSVNLDSYTRIISRLAGISSPAEIITDEAMVGASEKFFYEKSVLPCLEQAFFALIESLQCSDGIDYYFTETPDFKIKSVDGRRKRVIATLKYIPSKEQIRFRALRPIGGVDWHCKKINDTLAYEYRIDASLSLIHI